MAVIAPRVAARLLPLAGIAALFWSLVLAPGVAHAQEGGSDAPPFTIQLVDLSEAEGGDGGWTRQRQGALTATVDGVECVSVAVTTADPPAMVVGTDEQPEACQRAGATVVLFNEGGLELFERFELRPGETAELVNFAPSPSTSLPPAAAGGGVSPGASDSTPSPAVAWPVLLAAALLVIVARLLVRPRA